MNLAEFLGLWALFYCGFASSLLLQAQTSVSSTSNGLDNVWQWMKVHRHLIAVRLFLSGILSPLIIAYVPKSLDLPIWSVYGAAGFISDSVLDKILFIFGQQLGTKVEVPQIAPPPKEEGK